MRITEPYTIFLRTLESGKKVYYYQYRDENGKRSPAYSCGTSKHSVALRLCQKLYNEGKFKQHSSLKFKTFSKNFFDDNSEWYKWKEINGKKVTKSTQEAYTNLLKYHLLPFFGDLTLSQITIDRVKKWVIWIQERASPKTSNNAQTVLNTILKSAKEKKLIETNPCENLTFRKVQKRNRELLTTDELHQIYLGDWKYEASRTAFLVTAITGMRIGEVTALQVDDVEDDRLNVTHTLHPDFGLGQTKTKICRYVPIPPKLNLKSKCGSKWVFQFPNEEKAIDENYIYRNFIAICKSLNIDTKKRGITLHSLRNTFISYMRGSSYGEKIDLKIKAVVGHSDSSMTDWYTYWKPEMFPEIYEIQETLYDKIIGVKNENK